MPACSFCIVIIDISSSSSLVIAKMALDLSRDTNRMGVMQSVCAEGTGLRLGWNIDRQVRQHRHYMQVAGVSKIGLMV